MGMTRANAVTFLHGQFAAIEQATDPISTGDDDPLTGYGSAIDDALLRLGVSYDDLATAEVSGDYRQVDGYRRLLRFYALTLLHSRLTAKPTYNPSTGGVTEAYSNRLKQVETALGAAAQAAATAGYPVSTGGATRMHEVSVDIYDPIT